MGRFFYIKIKGGGDILKIVCQKHDCGKKLILKDGSLDKPRSINCPKCGTKNIISKKKNGKFTTN